MKTWDKLLQVNLNNKERFQNLFSEVTKDIRNGKFALSVGETEKEDHYIITEENRMDSYFVHIVPKQVYDLFKEMQAKTPNDFLGFSVLAGKFKGKDIRVSCFGVQCNLLGKALASNKKV